MSRCVLILLLGTATAAAGAATPRFTGEGHLRPPDTVSDDGRFALEAKLVPATLSSDDGRFSFKAALFPDGKSIAFWSDKSGEYEIQIAHGEISE